ncbi:MAG TPA: helix-hairpin-helix domain-containing protein [Anaeromyxobacteraceae bacterium]
MSRALLAAAAAALLLGAAPAEAKRRPLAPGEKVDLNRASVADLMRLPGIGRQRAEAIAALRAKRPFRSPAEVTQVKGIGKAWLERNRGSLVAGEPAPRPKASPGP